jgi:hypothetical protein
MKNLVEFLNESTNTSSKIITEASLSKMQLGEYESKNQPFQIAVVDVNGELMTDWWIGLDDLKHIKTKKQLFKELMGLLKLAKKEAKRKAKEEGEDYNDDELDYIALYIGDSYDNPALAVVWPDNDNTDFYEFEPYYNENAEFHGYVEKEDFEGPEKEALSAFLAALK